MKHRMMIIFLFSLLLSAVCFSAPAFAGWEKQWSYEDEDGAQKKNEWIVEDGKTYYADAQGVMVTGWLETQDGETYFFDDGGAMVYGLNVIDGRLYYFGGDGALERMRFTVDGRTLEIPREGLDEWGETLPLDANVYSEGRLIQDRATNYGGSFTHYVWSWITVAIMAAMTAIAGFLCRKRKDFTEIVIVMAAVIFASTPLFLDYLISGHDSMDSFNRILGVRETLKTGMFPVRLNGYAFWGYGCADPIFSPQLFLYIPAALCIAGMPFVQAVECFLFLINASAAAVMYGSAKRIFQSSEAACVSAVLYVLCLYRVSGLYAEGAVGEALAMVFFPLAVCGIYELLYGEAKRWYLLTLALTGTLQSHMTSFALAVFVCAAAGLFGIRRFSDRRRLAALGKAALFFLLLNLWFLIPLLDYMGTEISAPPLLRLGMQGTAALKGAAACGISFACGFIIWRLFFGRRREKPAFGWKAAVYLGVLCAALVPSQYYLDKLCVRPAQLWGEADISSSISDQDSEYCYPGTDKNFLTGEARSSDDRVTVLESGNTALSAYCSYQVSGDSMENVYLEMPALYYPGYHAVDEDGRELPIERGTSNVVRAFPLDQSGTIYVYFKERHLWRLAELVSLVSFAGFPAAAWRDRRRWKVRDVHKTI